MRLVAVVILVLLMSVGASAQTKYSTWSNPDSQHAAGNDQLQNFLDKLNSLIAEAEKSRAADPNFLRDLKDLANGFDRPWKHLSFSDDFLDGDFNRNPTWSVTQGRYFIENGWGLRNAVEQAAASSTSTQKLSGEQAAIAILGQILNRSKKQQQQEPTQPSAQRTAIHAPFPMSNAFSVELELSSWNSEGRFVFAAYQGQIIEGQRAPGYRLAYTPGRGIELLRVNTRSSSIIERADGPFKLEDKNVHKINWTRGTDGSMTVMLDDKEIIKTVDRGFRDNFNGVMMTTRGGDFIVKKISVYGTN